MITIYYPSSPYNPYLLAGFQELGSVVISEKLSKLSCNVTGFTVSAIDIKIDSKTTRVWYDSSDFAVTHTELMNDGDIYFKVQYYDDVVKNAKNVFPIGFGTSLFYYFDSLDERRKLKNQKKYDYDIIAVFRTSNYTVRRQVVEIIRGRQDWKSLACLEQTPNRPTVPKEIVGSVLPYLEHLKSQCRSKLCLAIQGAGIRFGINGRVGEILGTGNCLILPKLEARMPESLEGSAIILKKDLSDMEEKVDYYINNDEEREKIAKSGLTYYEKWLSPKAMCQNIINKVINNG